MSEKRRYLARFVRDVMETCPEGTGITYIEPFQAELITSWDLGGVGKRGYRVYGNWRLVELVPLGAEDDAKEPEQNE